MSKPIAPDAERPLFLRALAGKPLERLPVWVMRQAGRYLPEYREVRARHSFLDVCRSPELACEVTLQPIRRFGFDASIVFSDIMMPLEQMGVDLAFSPGPVIGTPIRTRKQVDALRIVPKDEISPYVGDTIAALRRELPVPLIGFAGAPLTLAAYLVEGKGSKDFATLRAFLAAEPKAAEALLEKLAAQMLSYLTMQIERGAQAIQLFDSWAGLLDEPTYRRFALPAVQHVMRGLRNKGVPRIYFAQNAAAILSAVREVEADALGVDWRQSLGTVREATGDKFVLQGNLDPAILCAGPEVVREATRRCLSALGKKRHVFNLGHGILPQTPIPSVETMLEEVRAPHGQG